MDEQKGLRVSVREERVRERECNIKSLVVVARITYCRSCDGGEKEYIHRIRRSAFPV